MASTRRSPPADPGALEAAAAAALAPWRGGRVAVAYSGGRDSTALLAACAATATDAGVALAAIHVHHGLSAHADAWARACARVAARLAVPLEVRRVDVRDAGRHGTEAAARTARYAALADAARWLHADAVALAHHADDQAETLLLQALRGAGPHGLAAMAARRDAQGIAWLRPLLALPRAAIDAYVHERSLPFVDDDSNASTGPRRNALRHEALPLLLRGFPHAVRTLARAASHQAEAAGLLDDLAAMDAQQALSDGTLDCAALASLSPPRARNLLRWFLRRHGLPAASSARLDAMLRQLRSARGDAAVALAHAGRVLGVHRGRVHVHAPVPPGYALDWRGEPALELPHGRLALSRALGAGIDAGRLASGRVLVASRRGGERFAPDPARPRRALAAWLREGAMPAWERDALPLVWCGDDLVAVPTLGVAAGWQAAAGHPGLVLDWRPHAPAAWNGMPVMQVRQAR